MKIELVIPSNNVDEVEAIISHIWKNETGFEIKKEEVKDELSTNLKLSEVVNEEFTKRILQWSSKVEALAKLKAKDKNSEARELKKIRKEKKKNKSVATLRSARKKPTKASTEA